MNVKGAK